MREKLTAKRGWAALAAGVLAYEVAAPQGELLSEGVDKALEHDRYRYLALGAIGITAAHLANMIPERIDPFHHAFLWKNKGVRPHHE